MNDPSRSYPLPPFSEALLLSPLPGDGDNLPMAVVDVEAWRPADMPIWGYLVLLEDGRNARILGCLEAGGVFWPCSGPLAARPSGTPLARGLMNSGQNDGEVEVYIDGAAQTAALWGPCPGGGQRLHSAARGIDLGAYGSPDAHLDFRGVTAAGALLAWRLGDLAAIDRSRAASASAECKPETAPEPHEPVDDALLLSPLLTESLPDALEEVVERGKRTGASPVARYVARSLEEAGALNVRGIVATTGADVVRLSSTRLWWVRFPQDTDPETRNALLAVEAALNRAQLLLDAGTLSDDDACDRCAFDALRAPGSLAADAIAQHKRPNPLTTFHGTKLPLGGEWDIRTRMAHACERLRLPFRLEYRYDANASTGCMAVEYALPRASWFPSTRVARGATQDCQQLRGAFAALYGLRLSSLLAACAFGTSVAVTRCVVTAFDGSLGGQPLLSCDFDRGTFSRRTLKALAKDAEHPAESPSQLADSLKAHVAMDFADGSLRPVEPYRMAGLKERQQELWLDHRPLSPELSSLVLATTAAELDVYHDEFPAELEEVRAICSEESETPVVAIMRLEELCDRVLSSLEHHGGLEGRSPLWSNSSPVRMLMAHAPAGGTRQTGVDGARDPLGITGDHNPQPAPPTGFFQVPDAYFQAKDAIMHFYEDLGDYAQAMACADQCVALAPTSIPPRMRRAVLLGDHGEFARAEEELKVVLTMLVEPDDTAFCLYRLAFAYWRQQKVALGASAYVMAARSPKVADAARQELDSLLHSEGVAEPTEDQARAALEADGVQIAQNQALLDTLAEAGARLTDEGFPVAAWRPIKVMAEREASDDLHSVGNSLRDGTPSAYL